MPITKTDVDKLGAGTLLWDAGKGSVLGFGVRKQRRDPVFVLKYSLNGRQRWYTIGRFGSPWTVDLARLEATKLLGRIASGEDPCCSRDNAKVDGELLTMADACDQYLVVAKAGAILTRFNRPKKASTLDIDVGRIERHIKPLIGSTRVKDVDARIVKRLIQDVTVGKTAAKIKTKPRGRALVTGGAATAARVADLLSGIMTWAVDEGFIGANPVHRIRRYRSEPRRRFLNDSELDMLGARIRAGVDPEDRPFHPYAIAIIQLLCLTGCRSSEIAALEWTEVDLEQNCLRLEDTKSGRSLRAIGNNAVEFLTAHSRIEGRAFVFPGLRGQPTIRV